MSTKTESTKANAPSHFAYHVREREGKKSIWIPIGAVWPHADGLGSNLQIDVTPLSGHIVIRVASEKKN